MENNVSKETKRRFFRKTGSIQKSMDGSGSGIHSHSHSFSSLGSSHSQSPNQSPIPSMGQSFESPYYSGVIGGGGGGMNGMNSNSLMNSPRSSMSPQVGRPGPGNSISLDETEIKMSRHRHFTATPRRARSAERFDGMRIAFSSPASGDAHARAIACAQLREELLARHRGSPQQTSRMPVVNNGVTSIRQQQPQPLQQHQQQLQQQNQLPGNMLKGMASPPPPYTAAVTDNHSTGSGSGPPSYRQAVAAAIQAKTASMPNAASMTLPPGGIQGSKKGGNGARYTMPSRATQSFDTNLGMTRGTLRSAASVPVFSDDSVICSCSKCQVLQRSSDAPYNPGEYGNDAVYMESQAFLMHEIMTDGMAFCSIV